MATARAGRDDSLMDKEAITEGFNRAVEDFLTNNFSIQGLIGRLGGGESGKRQLVDMLGGKPETARRNVNRWLKGRQPKAPTLSRLHNIFLRTVKRVKVSAPGTYTDYTGARSAYRPLGDPIPVQPPAGDRNAAANFIEHMQRGDTVSAWDNILNWYGAWPGALIPEPGEVDVTITFE